MALRKAIGTVKDQTSIGLAKVARNIASDLEVAVVKATSHHKDPSEEKHIQFISSLISRSSGYAYACVVAISKRLKKTKDWVVALKSLMLVDRLLNEGDELFLVEIEGFRSRKGVRVLNLGEFRDEAHSSSWDQSAYVRAYAMYLDEKVEVLGRRGVGSLGSCGEYGEDAVDVIRRTRSYGDLNLKSLSNVRKKVTPLKEMMFEELFVKMRYLQRVLDRCLACRPTGLSKNCRMVLIALCSVVRESFHLYADICKVLAVLLDKFFDMEYEECVKVFEVYAHAAEQIDDLIVFYRWCKEMGVARSSEYPEVSRISAKLLETLEEFVRDRLKRPKSLEKVQEAPPVIQEDEEPVLEMNEIKALPAPDEFSPPLPSEPKPQVPQVTEDLVDLWDEVVSADDQVNKLALILFAEPHFLPEVTSGCQTPAAEPGKADWELALVETASYLTKQKPALGSGLDPLFLNGMYDHGSVIQHINTAHLTGGSAISVALPNPKTLTPVLALPAPDGSTQLINQDPFAASLAIPPPSYVQMADMEKKQALLAQGQLL